ncbi:hypothetical protein J6590_011378 [Homalodisca vitripennis]|nr:hypothetical protein J6590_011378 [Homalodisca vitripennis]
MDQTSKSWLRDIAMPYWMFTAMLSKSHLFDFYMEAYYAVSRLLHRDWSSVLFHPLRAHRTVGVVQVFFVRSGSYEGTHFCRSDIHTDETSPLSVFKSNESVVEQCAPAAGRALKAFPARLIACYNVESRKNLGVMANCHGDMLINPALLAGLQTLPTGPTNRWKNAAN